MKFVEEDTPLNNGHLAKMASNQLCKSLSVFVAMYIDFLELLSDDTFKEDEDPDDTEFRSLQRTNSKQYCFNCVLLTLIILVSGIFKIASSFCLSFL